MKNLNILVVDGNRDVGETFRTILQRYVGKVFVERDSYAGIRRFLRERPEMVIADPRLGMLEDPEFFRLIRMKGKDTVLVRFDDAGAEEDGDVDYVLPKLFRRKELLALFDRCMGITDPVGRL